MIYYSDEITRLKTVMFTKLIDGHKFQSNPSIDLERLKLRMVRVLQGMKNQESILLKKIQKSS